MRGALAGLRILVTRPHEQAGRLSDALRAQGAEIIEAPVIAIVPPTSWEVLDRAIVSGAYAWVIFTSVNAVRFFMPRLPAAGRDVSWFDGTRVAAIGPETARALRAAGITPDLVPDEFVAEALVACLADDGPLDGMRILLPQADIARDALANSLSAGGAHVERVVAYQTVAASPPPGLVTELTNGTIDAVTFTSASTVRGLLRMLGPDAVALNTTAVACIGPITAGVAQELGLTPHIVASTYTIPGLVAALCDYFGPRAPSHSWAG